MASAKELVMLENNTTDDKQLKLLSDNLLTAMSALGNILILMSAEPFTTWLQKNVENAIALLFENT